MPFQSVVFIFLIIVTAGNTYAEGIYKWIDENGQVHYGEKPPENAAGSRELNLPNRTTNSIPVPDLDRKNRQQNLLRALTEERQMKEEAKAEKAKEQEQRRQRCLLARDRLKTYERASLMYNLNANGERVYLSDKDRDQSVANFKRQVEEWCNQ